MSARVKGLQPQEVFIRTITKESKILKSEPLINNSNEIYWEYRDRD